METHKRPRVGKVIFTHLPIYTKNKDEGVTMFDLKVHNRATVTRSAWHW